MAVTPKEGEDQSYLEDEYIMAVAHSSHCETRGSNGGVRVRPTLSARPDYAHGVHCAAPCRACGSYRGFFIQLSRSHVRQTYQCTKACCYTAKPQHSHTILEMTRLSPVGVLLRPAT